jgi:hypothetical protein
MKAENREQANKYLKAYKEVELKLKKEQARNIILEAEKDKIDIILLNYTKWLRDHEFVITMSTPEKLVETYKRAIKKVLNQRR